MLLLTVKGKEASKETQKVSVTTPTSLPKRNNLDWKPLKRTLNVVKEVEMAPCPESTVSPQ